MLSGLFLYTEIEGSSFCGTQCNILAKQLQNELAIHYVLVCMMTSFQTVDCALAYCLIYS